MRGNLQQEIRATAVHNKNNYRAGVIFWGKKSEINGVNLQGEKKPWFFSRLQSDKFARQKKS